MNRKIPFYNKGKNDVHIGSVTVPAGETRMVESAYVLARSAESGREEQKTEVPAPEPEWTLEAFVKLKQDDEIKALPTLSDEQFAEVQAYYQTHQPPKKLEKALPIEAEARKAQKEADDFADALKGMTEEELQGELLAQAEDAGRLALVQAELSHRDE
ncbi:hypothetical protein NX722_13675 [Endozoicomonas gorgoniicola]|uniref:Mu-like prophage FluMu N-terminal domain-containing protein n=1 Tax=Endozoicomonas gorgoniicola TaxID=1234144 RepID=A0ABT3MWA8_9GAMM|nr:hypothetical protein [Endozoicomonas gorgoniicola]MCW7553658.1 hypothetical protein [Endozoicomonas gorgoniicola]